MLSNTPTKRCANIRLQGQKGFTLIEALVAIIVVGVGMMGLFFLQAQGLKFNNSAYTRTQSTFSAYDIADRMRTNRIGALSGAYAATAAPGSYTDCDNTACDTAQMAVFDVGRWYEQMQDEFGGDGQIAFTAPNRYTITVTWAERAVRANDNTADADLVAQRQQMWEVVL